MRWRTVLPFLFLSACTGMTLGENQPGQDTWVDPPPPQEGEHTMGAVAVERGEERIWVVHQERRGGETRAHLAAVDADTGVAHEVMDVSGTTDRRVVFPAADRMLLMAQRGGREHLVLFDTARLAPIVSAEKPTWYWGTRTSPSGSFLVVADNADPLAPLHFVDLKTLGHRVVEHGGEAIEAMWNRTEDRLLAVSVTDPFGAAPVATLLRYDLRGEPDLSGGWPAPELEVSLPGLGWDFLFSFTWVGVSPDDRWAVFPLRDAATGERVLAVLDQRDGSVRTVAGAGPVGFTPDGSTIVSYGSAADGSGEAQLWLIDPVTLATDVVQVPIVGGLSFFVTWDGNFVVCTSVTSDDSLVIYDPATGETVEVAGPHVDLRDFVTRPGRDELWLESGGGLYRLGLGDAVLQAVTAPFVVDSLNIRPVADQLVLGASDAVIARFSPETQAVVGAPIELASPFDADAAYELP